MPVMGSKTPTVNVSVPVPTPVQSAPKRPQVQFAPDETPQQPVGPSGVPPVAPPRPQMSAVILPWSPPPKGKTQMRRVRRYERTPFNDRDFTTLIKQANPKLGGDIHPIEASVLADWLQDRDDWRSHLFRSKLSGYSDVDPPGTPSYKRMIEVDHGLPSWNEVQYDGSVPKPCNGEFCEPLHVVQWGSVNAGGGGVARRDPRVLVRSWYAVPHRNKPNDPTYSHYRLINSVMTPEEYHTMRSDAARTDPGVKLPEPPPSHAPQPTPMSRRLPRRVVRFSAEYDTSHLLQPSAGGRVGKERATSLGDGVVRYVDSHGSHRFVLHVNKTPVAAIQVMSADGKSGRVVGAYTSKEHRRKGYGRTLIEKARSVIPNLTFDDDRSDTGRGFVKGVSRKKRVTRYSATPTDLAGLFRAARENPYEPTHHAVIADALDEAYPGNHISGLIRRQFGFGEHGGEGQQDNLWYEPVENSWDGSFPYAARLGTHGPFNVYLRHEGGPEQSQRWVLHAVSRLKGSRDFGYTFEFPHESAHEIPRMFPAAERHIHPGRDMRGDWTPEQLTGPRVMASREREAREFDDRMDEEERNRP